MTLLPDTAARRPGFDFAAALPFLLQAAARSATITVWGLSVIGALLMLALGGLYMAPALVIILAFTLVLWPAVFLLVVVLGAPFLLIRPRIVSRRASFVRAGYLLVAGAAALAVSPVALANRELGLGAKAIVFCALNVPAQIVAYLTVVLFAVLARRDGYDPAGIAESRGDGPASPKENPSVAGP